MRILYFSIAFTVIICAPTIGQICPGTEGQVTYEVWREVPDDQLGELTSLHSYPAQPTLSFTRFKSETPINFDDYYGGRMRGYIHVDSTSDAVFNITGDDYCYFYLSTDSDPANMVLRAETNGYTGYEEHDSDPAQTSPTINLVAGQDYYFELFVLEYRGGDRATLWWQTDLVDPLEWNIITTNFLKDVDCLPVTCPALGTPCDDADATTTDDKEDGYCNCVGTPTTTNSCIGERSVVKKYRYENIPGSNLEDLYEAPNFPAMPEHSEELSQLGYESRDELNDMGHLVQGYITVPVTGSYKFNVTGNDQTIFFLSSDDDPVNKQTHQILVSGWTGTVEHDKYLWQNTAFLQLTAGQYYYYEVNHKGGGGAEHFSVFWQTPYTDADVWKRIPDMYLYDYGCSISCIAEGTLCDDGDPFTNDDQYNADCECAGTPCEGADCDSPLANYVPYDKCAVTDQLDDNGAGNWLSCETSESPNTSRGIGHWIQYDMGERHLLFQTQVWNYNVPDSTDRGFQMVAVDYSLDGNTWTELGTYNWPLAPGDASYSGFLGPDFQGLEAEHVLFTCLDASPECKGLGKVAFTAVKCPLQGTACDDDNPDTIDDVYNNNCECIGSDFLSNDCDEQTLVLGDSLLTTDRYSAIETVQSVSEIDGTSKVSFIGGDYVILDPGFETQADAVFVAAIDTCAPDAGRAMASSLIEQVKEERAEREVAKAEVLQVISSRELDEVAVNYYLAKPIEATVEILDANGSLAYRLTSHEYTNAGLYTKRFRTKKLSSGVYTVKLSTAETVEERRLVVE